MNEMSKSKNLVCHVDNIENGFLSGWIINTECLDETLIVELYSDRQRLATVSANHFRNDLKEYPGVPSSGNYGFFFDVDSLIDSEKENNLFLKIYKHNAIIFKDPIIYKWHKKASVFGNLEFADDNLTISGWAFDEAEKKSAIVEVYVNGKYACRVSADLVRPDIQKYKNERLRSGFSVELNPSIITGLVNFVSIRVSGSAITKAKVLEFKNPKILIGKIEHGLMPIEIEGFLAQYADVNLLVNGENFSKVRLNREGNKLRGYWDISENFSDGLQRVYQVSFESLSKEVISDTLIVRYPDYEIFVDHADFNNLSGWVAKLDDPSPVRLGLKVEEEFIEKGCADRPRIDVKSAHNFKSDKHGFHFHELKLHGDRSVVSIVDLDTNIVIADIVISKRFESLREAIYKTAKVSSALASANPLISKNFISVKDEIDVEIKRFPFKKSDHSNSGENVAVIVPVYDGYIETAECLDSIFKSINTANFDLIIVNDASPNADINEYLAWLRQTSRYNFKYFRKIKNGGFSEAVNIGFVAAGERDVVIVNADAVVQDNWLDKLIRCADQDERIATVTPFTNNGEVATFPYICKSLKVSTIDLAKKINSVAEKVNSGKIIDLPVAIGFCMYIRRSCLEDIGYFDAQKWGRGYGEETEFCIKALSHGWRHVLAADSFAIHRGGVSFGNEKLERIINNSKIISKDYPFYDSFIQRYIKEDPASKLRRRISLNIIKEDLNKDVVLFVSHGFGGGTKKYVDDLSKLYENSGFQVLSLTFDVKGIAKLSIPTDQYKWKDFFDERHIEEYERSETISLVEDLNSLNISKVHLNSPFGIDIKLLNWLKSFPNIDVTVHDYSWICPWVTMLTPDNTFIGDLDPDEFDRYPAHPALSYWVEYSKENRINYIDNFLDLFRESRNIFVGALDVKERMLRHGFNGNYVVREHPNLDSGKYLKIKSGRGNIIKVGIIGAISDIKGYWKIFELASYADEKKLPIEFIVFGYTQNDSIFNGLANVNMLGKYKEEEIHELAYIYGPDFFLFYSQLPETFSYTLSLAFRLGVWPLASNIGAIPERIIKSGFGTVFDLDIHPQKLCSLIISLASKKKSSENLPPPLKTMRFIEEYIAGDTMLLTTN
ncbi:glycosyltransferase [Pseudomonas luteola]